MWSTHNIVYFVDLVHLILTLEERFKHDDFVEYTSDPPDVDLAVIVAVGEQALGWSVPSSRDVLSVGHICVHALAATEVGELDFFVATDQDVLSASE